MITTLLSSNVVLLVLIAFGCFLLIKGADYLVDNASGLARYFNVPALVIGMTVVAFGTSMPEFVVNVFASGAGNPTLALTNIYGSNFINVMVILGLSSVIYPIKSKTNSRKTDIPIAIGVSILLLIFNLTGAVIAQLEGVILLLCFCGFLYIQYKNSKDDFLDAIPDKEQNTNGETANKPIWKYVLMILISIGCLTCGGQIVVKSATALALNLGISDAIIGLTIVALGTSLPELATSCVAAYKKDPDIALGNIIGSNIFNILMVIGLSSVILPLPVYDGVIVDGVMDIAAAALVYLFVMTNKQHEIKRWHGILLLLIYAGYLAFRITSIL
jgi:cation:H+ antiporter